MEPLRVVSEEAKSKKVVEKKPPSKEELQERKRRRKAVAREERNLEKRRRVAQVEAAKRERTGEDSRSEPAPHRMWVRLEGFAPGVGTGRAASRPLPNLFGAGGLEFWDTFLPDGTPPFAMAVSPDSTYPNGQCKVQYISYVEKNRHNPWQLLAPGMEAR